MKVFISHSWMNKTPALRIAESLKEYVEVWFDINQLAGGDAIQAKIDQALARMDVVILLWSADAATSSGVAEEIWTTKRLEKPVLPVLLDETPLDRHPLLKGLYGIRFDLEDTRPGLFRVQAALARMQFGEMDLESTQALNDLSSFEGFHAYIHDYRNRKQIAGDDSALWATRAMEQTNQTFESVGELRDQVGNTLQYLQDVFARVQAAGNDAAAVRAILDEVRRHPRGDTKEFKVLADFVQDRLSALDGAPAPAAAAPVTEQAAHDFRRRVESHAAPPPRAGAADQTAIPPVVEAYIRSAPSTLEQFTQVAAASSSVALLQVAGALHAYLENPYDLIPDQENGLLGHLDDAWLIHNTVYRCLEAGLFGPEAVAAPWDVVVEGDPMVLRLLPPLVRTTLEELLMQYMAAIAAEAREYQPRLASTQQAPWMTDAGGGGDDGSWNRDSIDDYVAVLGDKAVFLGSR
ncbi:MAG TPA: toll/interleukin-1 receptor domain-containing protein [Longimicrobium sp.]|nr:toll/interleukin-1 receptor domain-containing protein [Longimicrobium sp.]